MSVATATHGYTQVGITSNEKIPVYRNLTGQLVMAESADSDVTEPDWIYGPDTPETRAELAQCCHDPEHPGVHDDPIVWLA